MRFRMKRSELVDGLFKYKWIVCVIVALISALVYDHFRTTQQAEPLPFSNVPLEKTIYITNPVVLRDPGALTPGEVAGKVDATTLYEEFRVSQTEAEKKYMGKTYLITGSIIEEYHLRIHERSENSYDPMNHYRITQDISVGIMLLPETKTYIAQLSTAGFSFPNDPNLPLNIYVEMDTRKFEDEYARLIQVQQPESKQKLSPYLDYSLYSDDFSFRSQFGGVYCMFTHYRPGSFSKPKTKVKALCKIYEYRKGGLRDVEAYKLREDSELKNKRMSKAAVLAVGCVEIDYELGSRGP